MNHSDKHIEGKRNIIILIDIKIFDKHVIYIKKTNSIQEV